MSSDHDDTEEKKVKSSSSSHQQDDHDTVLNLSDIDDKSEQSVGEQQDDVSLPKPHPETNNNLQSKQISNDDVLEERKSMVVVDVKEEGFDDQVIQENQDDDLVSNEATPLLLKKYDNVSNGGSGDLVPADEEMQLLEQDNDDVKSNNSNNISNDIGSTNTLDCYTPEILESYNNTRYIVLAITVGTILTGYWFWFNYGPVQSTSTSLYQMVEIQVGTCLILMAMFICIWESRNYNSSTDDRSHLLKRYQHTRRVIFLTAVLLLSLGFWRWYRYTEA